MAWLGRQVALAVFVAAGLGGCSTAQSLLGGKAGETGAIAPVAPQSTPASRAYQVGTASARATKCGFFFDAAKLRSQYLAAETAAGLAPEEVSKAEKNYDVSHATMAKVIANETGYCSEAKTKFIKADLNRHLAGDYNPGAPHPKEDQDDGGLLSLGGGGTSSSGSTYVTPNGLD